MPKPGPQPDSSMDFKGDFNAGLWALNTLTAMIFPFIRSGQGVRSPGMAFLLAFCAIPVYATATESSVCVTFWYAWLAASLIRKLFPDRSQQTQYAGWPWLTSWLTLGLLDETKLRFLEPFLVLGMAHLLRGVSIPLANLIGTAALALAVSNGIGRELRKRRMEAIHDAVLEANLYR